MLDFILNSPLLRMLVLMGIFVTVMIVTFGVLQALNRRTAMRGAVQALTLEKGSRASMREQEKQGAWARIVELVERSGVHLSDTKEDRLRDQLIAAGFTSPAAPRIYTLVRLALIFLLPGVFLLVALTRPEPPSFFKMYMMGTVLGLAGLYFPSLFVRARADRRRETIVNGFPDALDLMLVCMEAGLGVEAALDRVSREVAMSHPLVAQLLGTAVLQLRAGATREEAFRRMADSAGVDEIRSFTTLLIQSDKLGTSVSSTLRVYSEEMREKRKMRAEEKAHRLPVLISIPLVVCMLPTMIGVILLPAAIRMVRDIFPLMSGG